MKKVPGYPKYFADEYGVIYSTFRGIKPLKPQVMSNGYLQVGLVNEDGKRVNRNVHRIIARTFIGEPGELHVDHVDGNKLNNSLSNLEYVTHMENIHRGIIKGTRKGNVGKWIDCQQCGNKRWYIPSRPFLFCSRDCYKIYKKTHNRFTT